MQAMIRKTSGKLPNIYRSWKRSLVEDGDVEENPGPSTTVSCLNVAGKHRTWNYMRSFTNKGGKVAVLQETNMTKEEQVVFCNTWLSKGYSVFFPAKCAKALVAVIVHNSVPTRFAGSSTTEWGQIVSVELGDLLLSGIYRHPRPTLEFGEMFLEHVNTVSRYQRWWAMGDWNLTPCDQRIWSFMPENTQVHFVRNNDGSARSTRWESDRCIDWCASACGLEPITLHLNETYWSDHLALEMQLDLTHVDNPLPLGTQDCTRPLHAAHDSWHDNVVRLWEQEDFGRLIPHAFSDIDDCWKRFNLKLELVLTKTSGRHKAGNIRPKGSVPAFQSTDKPHRHRAQQAVSFHERKLRKLLGRLKEAKRQGATRCCELACFVPSNIRLPETLMEAIPFLEAELCKVESDQREKALKKWKTKMRLGGKGLFEYVSRKFIPWSLKVACHPEEECSSTPTESLDKISAWWKTIWNRDVTNLQAHIQFWKTHKPSSSPLQWTGFIPKALQARAADLKQGSAGPDGWCGKEIAELPEAIWIDVAAIFNAWIKLRSTPESLRHLRQSCIPKKESSRTDRALSPADLRPIAVYSVWWRLFTSVVARDPSTRAWQNVWLPSSCFGGRQKKSVIDAIADLQTSNGKWILSLDLQKAFDFVHPDLATFAFKELGMNEDLCATLSSMWSHQKRWIALGKTVACSPCSVGSSLPQGDGLSPLAMNAVISAAVRSVETKLHRNERQCVYLDDRNVRTASLERAKLIQHEWANVSQSLGLHENESKARLLCADKAKSEALNMGFTAEQVQPDIRVLGIDITKNSSTPIGDSRITEALRRCLRLQRVPVSFHERTRVVCAPILSVACWGWVMKPLTDNKVKKLKSAIGEALWRPQLGSPHLHQLLTGHMADPQFRAGMWAARMWPTCNVVTKWLQSLNWQKQADGSFHHPGLGKRFSLTHINTDEIRHWLRESWRRIKWNMFISSGRRDTEELTEESYDECVCKATRKAFHQTDSHGRAVLVGAPCSDAMFDIIGGQNPPSFCTWCSQNVSPTWHHHAWECKAFRKTRPPIPRSRLAARFGWQVGSPHDANVLEHLALVRAKLAASRRPSAGGMRLAGLA